MKLLAEQGSMRLASEYEAVFLEGTPVPNLVVGDHYGDPIGGLIDREGRWVASIGEGLQVYRIAKPFAHYLRDLESDQWVTWESSRDLGCEISIESVRQGADGRLCILVAGEIPHEIIFEVRLSDQSIALVLDSQSA